MHRRDFMKTCAAFGFTLGLRPRTLFADCQSNENLFFINFIADGGWYPPHLIDPKLNTEDASSIDTLHDKFPEFSRQNTYDSWALADTESKHGVAGNIYFNNLQYPYTVTSEQIAGDNGYLAWGDFFEEHGSNILVINGIDVATGNHITGQKNTWGGHKNRNNPTLGALHAASRNGDLAIPYLSYGGYAETANEVALARISTSGQNTILDTLTSAPNEYLNKTIEDKIHHKAKARLQELKSNARLVRAQANMGQLQDAQFGAAQLACLKESYDNNTFNFPEEEPYINGTSHDLKKMARFVLSAFESGVAVSANIYSSGFDNHSWFNQNHTLRMAEVLDGLGYLLREAKARGLLERTVILVSSEFGRPPYMNDKGTQEDPNKEGRDHWDVTSAMLIGGGIGDNRVIGATDGALGALPLESGRTMTMEALHVALRNHLNINTKLKEKYPLLETDMDFLA